MPLISISCDGRDPPAALREKLAAAEGGGAAAAWLANHLFLRDPVAQAALALQHTRHMRVALMALSPLTMHPVQAAMAAATLDEAFPGRVTLCLGVGAPGDLGALGLAGGLMRREVGRLGVVEHQRDGAVLRVKLIAVRQVEADAVRAEHLEDGALL